MRFIRWLSEFRDCLAASGHLGEGSRRADRGDKAGAFEAAIRGLACLRHPQRPSGEIPGALRISPMLTLTALMFENFVDGAAGRWSSVRSRKLVVTSAG